MEINTANQMQPSKTTTVVHMEQSNPINHRNGYELLRIIHGIETQQTCVVAYIFNKHFNEKLSTMKANKAVLEKNEPPQSAEMGAI